MINLQSLFSFAFVLLFIFYTILLLKIPKIETTNQLIVSIFDSRLRNILHSLQCQGFCKILTGLKRDVAVYSHRCTQDAIFTFLARSSGHTSPCAKFRGETTISLSQMVSLVEAGPEMAVH